MRLNPILPSCAIGMVVSFTIASAASENDPPFIDTMDNLVPVSITTGFEDNVLVVDVFSVATFCRDSAMEAPPDAESQACIEARLACRFMGGPVCVEAIVACALLTESLRDSCALEIAPCEGHCPQTGVATELIGCGDNPFALGCCCRYRFRHTFRVLQLPPDGTLLAVTLDPKNLIEELAVGAEDDNEISTTFRLCNDPVADTDGDGDVDFIDFGNLQVCVTGEGNPLPGFQPDCACLDSDGDGDVDVDDFAAWQFCVGGAGIPADPDCDDDSDGDGVPDAVDNCIDDPNPLQVDLDEDGVGDLCDNCPTQPNPEQTDTNDDGGGDACAPSPEFAHCGDPFVPTPGIAPALFDKKLPHPTMNGVIHPVIQLSTALMDEHRDRLASPDLQFLSLHTPIAFNLFLAALPQAELQTVQALPFVRAIFPYPAECRLGEEICAGLPFARWSGDPRPQPSARMELAMASDFARQFTVLFGGDDGSLGLSSLGDTWEHDGTDWHQRNPQNAPSPRRDHAMAYDEQRGATVLFGGLFFDFNLGEIETDETWVWDGANWTFVAPTNNTLPTPRRGHAMAYDNERGHVVLFGGRDFLGNLVDDTWIWDGANWTEQFPADSPAPRSQHAMAFDAHHRKIVLFGGDDGGSASNDTWIWDGTTWERHDPINPPPDRRRAHAMAGRREGCGVFLSGGRTEIGATLDDEWFWDGEDWSQVETPSSPPARSESSLVHDAARQRFVLFGGRGIQGNVLTETWKLERSPVMDVVLHQDVPNAAGNTILADHDVIVLQPGVTIDGSLRVNTWHVAVPESEITVLAAEEPVVHVQFSGRNATTNDGSRMAIGTDVAQAPPFGFDGDGATGAGFTIAEIDGGWAAGDPAGPAIIGVAHAALIGRVIVRDLAGALNPPAAPMGCGIPRQILCNTCAYNKHATHVGGTMIGDGAGNMAMVGMAPLADIVSYEFIGPTSGVTEVVCELTDSDQNFGARLANNSWGRRPNRNQALYDANCQGVDRRIRSASDQSVIWSAGNAQQRCRLGRTLCGPGLPPIYQGPSTGGMCTAPPPGVTPPTAIAEPAALVRNRFFTVSGSWGSSAKNALVVGAVNSGAPSAPGTLGRMTTFSAWGPTQDGRIKPDLVAAGAENNIRDGGAAGDPDPRITSTECDNGARPAVGPCTDVTNTIYLPVRGTSQAAPAVTGGIALVLDQQGVSGTVPDDLPLDSDSLKALMIHTATDLQVHFPNATTGAFMTLQNCGGTGQDCWPVPNVMPGTVQDGPDYVNGWGLVNVPAAMQKVMDGNPPLELLPSGCPVSKMYAQLPFNSPLDVGGDPDSIGIPDCEDSVGIPLDRIWDWIGFINVPEGSTQLKVTIAWNDCPSPPPGAGATGSLLVNDLDLLVVPGTRVGTGFTPDGTYYYSWFLDPACPYRAAAPVVVNSWDPRIYADHRNNVEQVIIIDPDPGDYKIVVQGRGLADDCDGDGVGGDTQPFAIIISMPPMWP
ncbi:MAG: S8 family serine peptidase [Phycisphaerae bacterium]